MDPSSLLDDSAHTGALSPRSTTLITSCKKGCATAAGAFHYRGCERADALSQLEDPERERAIGGHYFSSRLCDLQNLGLEGWSSDPSPPCLQQHSSIKSHDIFMNWSIATLLSQTSLNLQLYGCERGCRTRQRQTNSHRYRIYSDRAKVKW